jgi:hypothetical protein
MTTGSRMRRTPITSFLLLALVFSTPFYLLLNLSGGRGEGMRLYVHRPDVVSRAGRPARLRLAGIPIATLGWRWPGARMLWLCYLLPLGYGLVAYAFIWGSGLGAFSTEATRASPDKAVGLATLPPAARVMLMVRCRRARVSCCPAPPPSARRSAGAASSRRG